MALEEALIIIEKEIDFIFDNYDSFVCKFIKRKIIDMYEISFSHELKFVYIEDSGCHICDKLSIKEYLDWKNDISTTN